MQERRHEFEGGRGGGQCIQQILCYTVKTLKFEKSGGVMTPPNLLWWRRPWVHGDSTRQGEETNVEANNTGGGKGGEAIPS